MTDDVIYSIDMVLIHVIFTIVLGILNPPSVRGSKKIVPSGIWL